MESEIEQYLSDTFLSIPASWYSGVALQGERGGCRDIRPCSTLFTGGSVSFPQIRLELYSITMIRPPPLIMDQGVYYMPNYGWHIFLSSYDRSCLSQIPSLIRRGARTGCFKKKVAYRIYACVEFVRSYRYVLYPHVYRICTHSLFRL